MTDETIWRIRPEAPDDRAAVRAVNEAAFASPAEADLVDALRETGEPLLAFVAEVDGRVVGHILFSPVTLAGRAELRLAGLAPMAVLPSWQRRGVGSALVRWGLDACRVAGHDAVVVLGHPEFYPRFGFVPASRWGIRSEYDVPDDVFLAVELSPGALRGASGVAMYHAAFGSV